jgi:daunorubicin resistance ABC transporter ATP-binding subunit
VNAPPDLAIRVEGLTKRFDTVTALDGIDLEVQARTVFGLLGPNGAGKTTTIRVLATILKPDAGRAEVLGHDVVREAKKVRTQIGLAGQYATVDANLTGRENLRLIGRLVHLPRREIALRSDALLERFELTSAADRPVRTYAGGMRRRIDLAAALVNRPPVLFLDEPTTGLDPYSRNEVWVMIGELVDDGTTVVLTTQYLEEADRLASRVAVVDEGRVIANDTPAQLKSRLGSTVIEIGLADAPSAQRAYDLLGRVAAASPELEDSTVRLTTHDGARLLVDALRALDGEQLVPATLTVREPSLDDVFLALTGHHAEQEKAG